MKHRVFLLLPLFLSIFSLPVYASQEGFYSLPVRDGAQQPFWLIEPDNPTHIVVLFAGGSGNLKITDDGIGKENNFLVRTRNLFADRGMATVVVDKPDDRGSLHLFRKTGEHAQDIKAVMDFIRKRLPGRPLWLVGTSRGTISVANIAARINGSSSPNGIVLTAAVTQRSNSGLDSLADIDLSAITIPALIVHHERDGCYVTPFDGARKLLPLLTSARVKAFEEFSGGINDGSPCKAQSYHGFRGIELRVVGSIIKWIRAH